MKLQLHILKLQDIEVTAKLNGASGGSMLHSCRMEGLGRERCNLHCCHEYSFMILHNFLCLFGADKENAISTHLSKYWKS